ncbi:MAG TPA: 3'(2'),5'-bisphosphate nucleotidase CysQ [Hanamia sp.]|nr:3'(2'),5'-bisphosphate nucleotidase CysQ [Hanamia sp.]
MADTVHLLQTAQHAALEAGKKIMEIYRSGDYRQYLKSDGSPYTIADESAHKIIMQHLNKTKLPVLSEEGRYIDFRERKNWEYFWMIDPLDGTKEFINKNDEFTVNIALVKKNIPFVGVIYVPCSDTLYYGSKETGVYKNEKGKLLQFLPLAKRKRLEVFLQKKQTRIALSRSHPSLETTRFLSRFQQVTIKSLGSSLKFMLLLENKADIYPRFGTTMEWDTVAAHAILNATNRGVYQIDLKSELVYNRADLRNPFFIAF